MTNIRNQIYKRDQLWSSHNGSRDYIKVGDEVFSINGLYCDEKGKQDRWGKHVIIIDIRWVVVERSSYDGKLRYRGDGHDVGALDHYGYTWDAKDKFPVGDWQRVPGGEMAVLEAPRG